MPTVLIIGVSRGIGLELLRQYAAAGWTVHGTVRDLFAPGRAGNVTGDVRLHQLEVTDQNELETLDAALKDVPLDVLIHNAGVYGRGMQREQVMAINAEAPIRIAERLLPRVAAAEHGRIVLVTSQMGARHGKSGSIGDYGDSKAALNDAFRARAEDWGQRGVTAIVIHPGWVRTDMGGEHATLAVPESARGIRAVVDKLGQEHHGHFLTWEGREHPW